MVLKNKFGLKENNNIGRKKTAQMKPLEDEYIRQHIREYLEKFPNEKAGLLELTRISGVSKRTIQYMIEEPRKEQPTGKRKRPYGYFNPEWVQICAIMKALGRKMWSDIDE